MLKVWITGGEGHVGRALCQLLDCTEYQILATDIEEVDITDSEKVNHYINFNRPDVVINCAGLT
ncbi:MAG: sugar nucleotide-binding protein, partial [Lachnospiraceae bacterium]|nr:sugar nucleotide-binding protein [Lachnospiraceae bacterium]